MCSYSESRRGDGARPVSSWGVGHTEKPHSFCWVKKSINSAVGQSDDSQAFFSPLSLLVVPNFLLMILSIDSLWLKDAFPRKLVAAPGPPMEQGQLLFPSLSPCNQKDTLERGKG